MQVSDFTARYPEIDDPELQQKLFNKTEFFKIGKENIKADSIYYTFQRNVGILLSPVTPYKKMLFFFEPGVGKTCSSILVHEISKQFLNNQIKPTVILTKGKALEDNYKTVFIKTCPGIEKHFSHDDQGQVLDKTALDREVKINFSFKKYSAFASYLAKMSDEAIKTTYSNRQYVLDEGQSIKNTKGKTYKQYLRFFSLVENVTVIILSGTPNTDHPSEAVGLINLLKDPKDRLPTGNKFLKMFYKGEKFITSKEDTLLAFYNGYVTYLKQTSDIEQTKFISNPKFPSEFEYFSTYNLVMEPFQRDVYEKALTATHKTVRKEKGQLVDLLKRDEQGNLMVYESKGGGTFMKLAREAATFTYPDGTYGAAGFKKNLIKIGNRIDFKDPEMATELKNNLRKYSVSFAESFKIINENPKRVFYIYFDNVNNSGLLMYAKLLELVLGFQQTDAKKSTVSTSKPKYVRIDGSVKTPISQILRKVGQKENADGSIVRIVLGSPLSGVGLTIPNATGVFVFDSQFTPSDITQIVNRINRPGTLVHLEEAGLPTNCFAYLFTSSPKKDEDGVDLDIYAIAEHKIILIEPQTELIERADPFCAISHNRNEGPPCYTAEPDKDGEYHRTEKDEKTDVLFWRKDEIDSIQKDILEKIPNGPVRVSDYLDNHEGMVVYRTVKAITKTDKIQDGGIIFLSGDLIFTDKTVSGDPNAAWYLRTTTLPTQISLSDILAKVQLEEDTPKIEKMFRTKDISIWNDLSKTTRINIWEEMWNVEKPSKFQKEILDQFQYYDIDDVPYHILYAEPKIVHTTANANAIVIENPSLVRVFIDSQWQYYRGDDINELIAKFKEQNKDKIEKAEEEINRKWGMYGKYDKKGNFLIVRLGQGKSSGRQCLFFTKADQEAILAKFGDVPENFDQLDKQQRCNLIHQEFKKRKIIV